MECHVYDTSSPLQIILTIHDDRVTPIDLAKSIIDAKLFNHVNDISELADYLSTYAQYNLVKENKNAC